MRHNKRAQQEMVGFVLIVVLVVVGLMVFLVISSRTSDDVPKSVEVDNMLGALMKQTTECAIVYEPDYDTFEDLFKSCHQGRQCSNLDVSACDYLNESLTEILAGMFATEATIEAYRVDFYEKDDEGGRQNLLRVSWGNCTGDVNSALRSVVSGSESIVIEMRVCKA